MKIAITGSSGFTGRALVSRLQQEPVELQCIDIADGTDIADEHGLQHIQPFDILVHLASRTFVPDSYRDPHAFFRTNVTGTLNMLELCRVFKARMIFASSYVYGHPQYLPVDEAHPVSAFNPYAQTKILGEQLCESYYRFFRVPVTIFRPFNLYGPGQNGSFLIPEILRQAHTGKIVLKDAAPRRDFLHVRDLVEAYVKAIQSGNPGFEIFNLGAGISCSVDELVQLIAGFMPAPVTVQYLNQPRENEVPDTVAGIAKARDLLGWQPLISLDQGLREMISRPGDGASG
jgi:nucleoside-diphosphate-sugar epimerase